jgi:hypothetical protein
LPPINPKILKLFAIIKRCFNLLFHIINTNLNGWRYRVLSTVQMVLPISKIDLPSDNFTIWCCKLVAAFVRCL